MKKRILAFLLCFAMVMPILPVNAVTTDTTDPTVTTETTTVTDPTDYSEPATEPSEPATEPSEPATEPSEPATEPSEPETEPSEPETEPSEPETEPVTEPSTPETEPTESETEPTEETTAALVEKTTSENGISVSGKMPEGVTVSAKLSPTANNARSISPMLKGVSTTSRSVSAMSTSASAQSSSTTYTFDISLQNADGTEWQPGEDGGVEVAVTFDLASLGFEDGEIVNIHHEHGDETFTYESLVVINGKVTVVTDSFSIFIVEDLGETTGTQITANTTYQMVAGSAMEVFYWEPTNNNSAACIWHVSDPDGAISYTVHERTADALNNYRRYAPYIQVTPVKVGTATLTMEYIGNNNNINSETFTIKVVAPEEFHIADKVAESGCLVPTWRENDEDVYLDNVTYQWERSDGQTIRAEAKNADGSVNISKDRGGVTNWREPITYTVTVTDAAGTTYTDSYQVLYGNEILNPSFETPVVQQPARADAGVHARFYNGYPGLYWKTTAPGATGAQLTQDVEIVRPSLDAQNYHGVNNPAHGEQYAEVNAEQFGTLYQDMLTTPGAEFTWSFSHTARNAGQNTLYVVVAGTEYAQEIVGFNQIDAILDQVRNQNIPQTGEGYLYKDAEENEYRIWRHTATYNGANANWATISGRYIVPEGQYLTRLFFASETTTGDNTQGNLIDYVNAGEQMTYRIEYYPDDALDNSKTQRGSATVYTAVDIDSLQNYLDQQYIVTNVTVNGVSYPNDVNDGLYISDYGKSNDENAAIVLKIYLKKQAITVTKKVAIEGWSDMTQDQRDALLEQIESSYTADFGLYTGETQAAVATVTITTIPESGVATAVCEFNKTSTGATFQPQLDVTYTVKEDSATSIPGYRCTTTYSVGQQTATVAPVSVKLSQNSPNAEVTCTNTYEVALGNLKIIKNVTKEYEKDTIPADDEFTFTVNLKEDGPYTYNVYAITDTDAITSLESGTVSDGGTLKLKGGEYALIKDIPAGEYTVTEADDLDYELTTKTGDTGAIIGGQTSVAEFTNEYTRHLGDLTISKIVSNQENEADAFVFTVTGPKDFSKTVVINGTGTVTIADLPIGEYTVTEDIGDNKWTWRYTCNPSDGSITKEIAAGDNTFEFTNTFNPNSKWLTDTSYAKNLFGNTSAIIK